MCNPIAMGAAQMAFAAVGTYMGIKQQNEMAEDQMEAAAESSQQDYQLLDTQQDEIYEKAGLDKFERDRQAMREAARIKVAGAESGAFGNSLLKQVADTMFQSSYDKAIIDQDADNKVEQSQAQKSKVHTTAKGRVNAAEANVTNGLMAGLKIGQAGVSGAASGYSLGSKIERIRTADK